MERDMEKLNLSTEEVDKQRAPELNINCLPEDIFAEIFGYLDFTERCRMGRVCKKWLEITRNPYWKSTWKRINLDISKRGDRYLYHSTENIIRNFAIGATYISLNFEPQEIRPYMPQEIMSSEKFATALRESCPNLKTLVLHNMRLNAMMCDNAFFCPLPQDLRILVLHHCDFKRSMLQSSVKIEVLDICYCDRMTFYSYSLPTMPHLKKLRLTGCRVDDESFEGNLCSAIIDLEILDLGYTGVGFMTFQIIRSYAFFLTELYMCNTRIDDRTLIINVSEPVLYNLKIICLRHCPVTNEGIISLIEWCQSLEHIYVGKEKRKSANGYNRSISEKVHIINGPKRCDHFDRLNLNVDCNCEKDVLLQ